MVIIKQYNLKQVSKSNSKLIWKIKMPCKTIESVELNESAVIDKLCSTIEEIAAKSIQENGRFTIGLSGGSLVKYLCTGLPKITTDWSKWVLLFCDERVVPEDSSDSTFGAYKKDLLPKVPLKEEQFITIKQGVSVDEAALDYRMKLAKLSSSPIPRFNLLLLGMGPDGHTCSLFPGHPLLEESSVTVAAIADSPKPPPERVTLTYPIINNAEYCILAICGEEKGKLLPGIMRKKNPAVPTARVQPANGTLHFILDQAAAKYIS